jgi:predicted glycoside hydrolase/deacetylase ChbG (UPF0249 family)
MAHPVPRAMASPIRLITRADDAGLTAGTNHAIAAACAAGAIRNVGLMAVAPRVEHAADLLRDMPGVALGLHFALNCEWDQPQWGPLAPRHQVRSLLDARGAFPRSTALLQAQNIDLAEVVAEAASQLARLRDLGLHLTYLDDHMACSWLPGMKEALNAFATREGLIFGPSEFPGLPRHTSPSTLADPRELASGAPAGIYLHVTHPAHNDAEFRAFRTTVMEMETTIRTRAAEANFWASATLADELQALGVAPCRYDEVFGVGDRLACPNW